VASTLGRPPMMDFSTLMLTLMLLQFPRIGTA
jgi:hypothetical protein